MKRLIYASRTAQKLSFEEVKSILNEAHKKNKVHGITGALVYNGESFLQFIEGDAKSIDLLMEKISKDKRHSDLKIIGSKEVDTHLYEDWTMAYVNDSQLIQKVIEEKAQLTKFEPHHFTYDQALLILEELRWLI